MVTLPATDRTTQLLMHALSSAIAMAADQMTVTLDLDGIDEVEPDARKAAVAARLRSTMVDLERVIRAKKTPPEQVSAAVLGRRLVENGEFYDSENRSYTPGPGFDTLLKALAVEADAYLEKVSPSNSEGTR